VYVATREGKSETARIGEFVASIFVAEPRVQGAIRRTPRSLLELDAPSQAAGLDLLLELRKRLFDWPRDPQLLQSRLVLVIAFPKTRTVGSSVEASDIWAFGMGESVAQIGEALSLWQVVERGVVGHLIGVSFDRERTAKIKLLPLNPHFALSSAGAAAASGIAPSRTQFVSIGVGALGSQIIGNLVRAGYGQWRFIDEDVFLPHNAARHELPHSMVGWSKVRAMTQWVNAILAEPVAEDGIVTDLLDPGDEAEALRSVLKAADVIADFSASQAVARHLARDLKAEARRVSAFLNPSGSDVVVLAEDALRQIPIDAVEMQYYRALLDHTELANHFRAPEGRIRTARSCRDVSTILPSDLVAHHAAVASRGLRSALDQNEASVRVWTTDSEFNTHAFLINPRRVVEQEMGNWRLITDDGLIASVRTLRQAKLPLETGGVLLGSWDLLRGIVYIVVTIPSPVDSEECPTSYIRGCQGLEASVRSAEARTGWQLQYVGEWHSHPDSCTSDPSEEDRELFEWLRNYTGRDGYSPVMLIAGEHQLRWFVDSL